jgi:hypothetical protein
MTEYVFINLAIAYALVGIWFVASTKSRGLIADVLFGVFWIVYLYSDWKNGRL